MSTNDDDLSSGINGRLRPRKAYISSLQTIKTTRRLDPKTSQERSKRVTTPSKALLNKPDDLSKKSDCTSVIDFLCPYCDKSFLSKQAASKHARRLHLSNSKQDTFINCLYCKHTEAEPNDIVRHMIDSHPNQYFACLNCHTRFSSTTELAEHKLNVCERQKLTYRSKLRKKTSRASKKSHNIERQVVIREEDRHGYNGLVISCELKPTHVHDAADIEDNITTNLILPPGKNLANKVIDKNAVIVLDDLQWNKRISHNFSFHNTDADQILSRLGVVHRSPRTAESTRKDWFKAIDDASQKFERCFDTCFYSKVASNVQENLSKFLDGSFNFNPDPNHTIKTRKAKNSVPINTVEGFPILLSCEQYSRNLFDGYMPRAIAPKHKWKWENLENDRNLFNADIIKRDSHVNNCIVTLVSSLDIWTQLCMRRKFEEKFKNTPIEKKTEKRNIIGKELKEILESRQLPISTSHVSRNCYPPTPVRDSIDFPASLGLIPTAPKYDIQPAVLSGEWVRPRCYVCCACGAQTRDPRALSTHISSQHPNAQVQHYEIAGELLLNADILKHLYVPPSPVHNRTRPLRGFRECTKCNKSITLEDLHQHMLDCAGDTPLIRRRCRYRQFGVRKRRSRISDNRIRKKIRKEIQGQNGRPRPKIRTEVGDAETIRKMLADLPAKRQRVMINPLNSALRPRRKIVKQRNQLTLKRRSIEDSKNRKTNIGSVSCSNDRPENNDPNKINKLQDENRSLQSNRKRVQNQLSRRSEIMNKKTVRKTRRKIVRVTQNTESDKPDNELPSNEPQNPELSSNKVQVEQLSFENLSNKVDVNSGSYNAREQANKSNNNGSNNRDNQNPDRNDRNGNSHDQGAPAPNIPLKHSIARLTADSDTQDKAVQFHHLFLVQQECNNVTQHVPSGQPVLFENKTVATKLDKPPLNVKDDILDYQNTQKGKSNKPRKGLNDCIAMLKNKLVEPIDESLSKAPNVSIQCSIDEQFKPSSQDVHKTIINSNRIDITVQCPETDISSTDTIITPRRRQSINTEKIIEKQIANLPTVGEYIKQNPDILIKHKGSENLNCNVDCQSIEPRKHVSETKLSTSPNIQQAITQKDPATNKTPRSSKQSQICETSEQKPERTKKHKKNTYPLEVNKCNEVAILQNASVLQTKQKITESEFHPKIIKMTTSVPDDNVTEKKSNYDKQNVINPVDSLQVNQEISRKAIDYLPEDQMKSKKNCADIIPPAHCNTNIESILVAPLDLSGKLYAADVIAHCSKQNITYDKTSERYETLDLSKKQVLSKEDHEVATLSFNDEVVDLRVKHITTTQSADSSLYSETNSATDLSLRITQIDCTPTDLSIKGKAKTSSIYGVRKEDIIPTESFYNTDVMPSTHKDESIICLNLSAKDAETPTDLSTKSIYVNTMNSNKHVPQETTVCQDSRMCINEEKNNYFNPSDLSCRGIPETQMGIVEKNNALTIQPVEVITKNDLHTTTMKTASILKSNNMENSGYEDHERYPYQSPKAPFNAKLVESLPNHSYVTTDDVAISLTNKQHPMHKSSNTLIHLDNSHEFVTNTDKGTYSLANMQSNAASHSHESTNVENSKLFTCTNNEYPTLTDIAKTTKNTDKSLVSSSKLLHETNIYSSMCEPTIVITPEPVSSVPSTSYADKQKVLDKNILGHKPKCASILEHTKSAEVNDKVITTTLDPDPETAKKIAMLPKELVEILGNMPIDHRNQLLNVLPQYVSTSTSPTSTQNIKSQSDEIKHNSFNYSNMSQYPYSGTHKSQQSPADAFQLQHPTANCMKSHNTTNLTKSIVDGSHLLVSIEETENTLIKTDIGTNKLSNECIISEDRIIDLTDDKNETLQPSSQNKEIKNLSVILKPVAHKTNNEKTASLRAVRIKAPSERQKSMIMEIQFQKTFQDNNNTITLNNDKNNQNTPGPLAVQQFEISTTEEAKEVNSVSPAINTKKDCSLKNNKELLNLDCSKDIIPDINIVTSDDDNAFKSCCTSSTMVESVEVKNNTPMTYEQPDIAPSKSDITKEDESKHNQLSTYGDINLNLLDESKTELSINTPQVDNLEKELYEDDSEDDVSLAIIVKQKLKNQKSQNVEMNETEKIETDKSHHRSIACNLENRNGRGGSSNKKLDSIDIGHDIIYDDTIEKHSKKIKRSRRNMNITMPKVANDHFVNNKNEFDVNKENTVNSDDTQLMKHHDCEQVTENNNEKMNCAVENDNLSIDNDTISIHHGKEKGKLKEKSDLSKDVNHITCNSEKNNQQRDEENSNVIENNMKIKKQHPYAIGCKLNAENLLCASKTVETIESIENQTTAKSLSQSNLQTQSSEKNFKNLTIQLERSVISSAIPQGENQVHSNSKFVNIHEINSMLSVNIASPQKDNLNTPLRRSRRGKSLFVENIDIFSDIKDKPDNEVEQRGPLTKKQLIFTKLLLDGDKSMNQINNAENNAVLQGDQNENDKSNITHLVSPLAVNTTSEQSKIKLIDKSHKRKQSPQTKKKLKRKKSSEKVESFGEELKETLKITEISNHDSHISLKEQPLTSRANVDTERILVGRNSVTTLISKEHLLDKSEDKIREKRSKPLSFKRKSNNSNADILPSFIPKKSKSNIDNEKNESNLKEAKKNKRESDVHSSKVEVIQPHNNKPAARRGRSKSVFAKSSVSELYDPYDINLEDMATKTEPFIKKGHLIKNLTGKKINKNYFLEENEKNEENNTPSTSNIDNNNLNQVNEANIQVESVVETRGILSDSDDSSKSDIPLKKYVEDKERKKFEIKLQDKNIEEANKAELRKRNKQTLNYSDKLGDICQDENQERIRSEQFMESFGFFSERKPRKSNLLATKKISETFHIIANEKDDTFFESRDKSNHKKGMQVESRKSAEDEGNLRESISSSIKKVSKRGRKKKISTKVEPSFCDVCRKEFHRPDNFLRHQMTLAHATRVSEADSKVKSYPMKEGSNYLVIYKQQLDRLRMLQDKITRRKKYCKSLEKIVLPTLEEIIADVTTTVKQQQLARRGLSRDEALFLDCCELLNASRKDDGSGRPKPVPGCNNCFSCAGTSAECLNLLEKRINESLEGICDDGDVDSITAQDILESEEVRNLENDLISGLKEAACANTFNGNNIGCAYGSDATIEIQQQSKVDSKYTESPNRQTDETKVKCKKVLEVKEKMYPDVIENIDMFEDKFDKIKRKCRSQAAKQTQYVETSTSHKTRKKVDKKKRKKSPKKNHHSSVPTKGALKGFDGVKVSISTSDIDMSSILPPSSSPLKKKRKNISKRKRERNNSGTSICDSDLKNKNPHSKLDVYEFMDNEDAELFEFRPSTLMERFKSIGNKDMPSTSRSQPACNDLEVSSESGSDGDDFVYMSDDYVCSDAETENSLMSCELGQVKGMPDPKKSSILPKRKETTEKNAVMGKIFKHNAVRTEKKIIKTKVQLKPKANLDQLFDSLLEEEPNSSILAKTSPSPKHENYDVYNLDSPSIEEKEKSRTNLDITSTTTRGYEDKSIDDSDTESLRKVTRTPSPLPYTTLISTSKKRKSLTPPRKIRLSTDEKRPSTSKTPEEKNHIKIEKHHKKTAHRKKRDTYHNDYDDITSKRRNTYSPNYDDDSLLRVDDSLLHTDDSFNYSKRKSKEKEIKNKQTTKSSNKGISTHFDYGDGNYDHSDDAGVARQRARRKCTVGKQNVLAETWSSESEPDGMPPRPSSADSVVVGVGRKRKGKKKEGQPIGGRKGNNRQVLGKKHEFADITHSNRNSCDSFTRVVPTTRPSAVGTSSKKVRPRSPPYYWSDDEEEQEHVQQHGWIVGDSHKKLVTMLAHAKGKRNNEDKRHLVE